MTDQLDRLNIALADRYTIERQLGRGGMATVYLAHDLKHDRKVAVKVFQPELAAVLGADRFLQEIRLTANLQHPHIVGLYDSGEADGLLYYVMPYVEGESLRDRLNREHRVPVRDTVRIASQVAAALEYAHRQNVVHRDIKPENIMLHGGVAMVADFGIARAAQAAGGERLTATGLAVGTPAYMSPEQATGTTEADRRSDLYSLGCVVYEMLAGAPPFTASTPRQILAKHVMDEAPPLNETAPDVSPDVAAVVERLLAKEPEDRFQTAGEFAEAMDGAVSGAVSTVATGVWPRGQRVWRHVVPTVGAYLVVCVVGVLFTQWLVDRLVLSPHLPAFIGVAAAALVPAVAVLAYVGGAPKSWRWAAGIAIPANLVGAVALLLVLFGGKDLGAATASVTVEDEMGNVVTRRVAKASFRKRVALFYLDNPTGDTSLTWLQYGIPWALALDLQQDLFMEVDEPLDYAERLREEGFTDGLGMPLALMRTIARERHIDWVAVGSVSRAGDELLVTTRLYDSRRGTLASERSVTGRDPFALVDEMSVQLRRDLDVPASHLEETTDVPVSDLLTGSLDAYRSMVEGNRAILAQDFVSAARHLDEAVAADSLFALAHIMRFGVHLTLNDSKTAEQAIERALETSYRLSERDRLGVKAAYYRIVRQDVAKAFAVMRMHVGLYPEDVEARLGLAGLHAYEGQYDSAAAQYEQVLEIDPSRYDLLVALGSLAERQGRFEESLEYYQRYATQFPESPRSHVALGTAYRALGRHDESLEAFERALLLDHTNHNALLGSAAALAAVGRLDETLPRLHEALDASQTASQRAQTYDLLTDYHESRGEMTEAVGYMHRRWAALADQGPFVQLQLKLQDLDTYVRAGQLETAFDSLASIGEQVPTGFETLLPLGRAVVFLEAEDADRLEGTIAGLEEFVRQFGVGGLNSFVELVRGKVLELRGQCAEALPHYQESLRLDATEVRGYLRQARCYRALDDLDRAERNAREFMRLRPYRPEGHYELALVLQDAGKTDEALEHARRAVEILEDADPGFELAERARSLVERLVSGRAGSNNPGKR